MIQRYVIGFLEEVPMLAALVESKTRESVTLANRVVIEIHTSSFRSVRGYTMAGAVCDEIAFWRSEEISANPDREILAALRPGLASIPGSLLLCLSSPYSRRGELFEAFKRYWGSDSPDVLVWKAPTLTMNPTIPRRVVESARERDAAAAGSEWDAEFRRDLEGFIDLDTVRALAPTGRKLLPPQPGVKYRAFVDPAGGSGRDSMTLAVSHRDGGRAVLDLLLEKRPPFSPEAAVEEFAEALEPYCVDRVTGDRYAGDWPAEQFRKRGVQYEPSRKAKSEIYLELLPALNSARVELLDHPRLLGQLSNLERRTSRAGRDIVDHPPNAHDDLANAVAGALVIDGRRKRGGVWGRRKLRG